MQPAVIPLHFAGGAGALQLVSLIILKMAKVTPLPQLRAISRALPDATDLPDANLSAMLSLAGNEP